MIILRVLPNPLFLLPAVGQTSRWPFTYPSRQQPRACSRSHINATPRSRARAPYTTRSHVRRRRRLEPTRLSPFTFFCLRRRNRSRYSGTKQSQARKHWALCGSVLRASVAAASASGGAATAPLPAPRSPLPALARGKADVVPRPRPPPPPQTKKKAGRASESLLTPPDISPRVLLF